MGYVLAAIFGALIGFGAAYFVLEAKRKALGDEAQRLQAESVRLASMAQQVRANAAQHSASEAQLALQRREFDSRVIQYEALLRENALLKRDLRNLDTEIRQLQNEFGQHKETGLSANERTDGLCRRYIADAVKWHAKSLTPNNYAQVKQRLDAVLDACERIGFKIPDPEREQYHEDLKAEFKMVVRASYEREEQARIKARIREEQRLERERQREVERLEGERRAIQAALTEALAREKDAHSAEVERLRGLLHEAEERSQRAMSQAQLTRAGSVYVISNIGAFGEGVFKIGMTRRLEPQERIRELSGAAVPFPYDVHMLAATDDAPALENALHKALHKQRVNKANPRKEFFRTDIDRLRQLIEAHHGEVEFVADAEAIEYRQSMTMSDEDEQFIEDVYAEAEDDGEPLED